MSFNRAVRFYVMSIAVAATVVLATTQAMPRAPNDWWAVISFLAVGCVLEVSRTHNKAGGLTGSLVFVFHLAVGLILGPFWGAAAAGAAKAIAEVYDRNPIIKMAFNVSERIVSVGVTFTAYHFLGGTNPPTFLLPTEMVGSAVSLNQALLQILVFLASAMVYFIANSLAVNSAVALASGRPVLSTWRSNTVWVFGYDIAASLLALIVAWAFELSNRGEGMQRLLFLGVILPLLFARHIYGQLNRLKDLFGELDTAYEQLELNVREQLQMMVKAI